MGQYLFFNIATQIVIPKKQTNDLDFQEGYSQKEIVQRISQYFDISLFNIIEDNDIISLTLKDEVTKKYLYTFLKEHLSYLHHQNYIDEIDKIKNMGTQEVIQYLKNEDIDYVYFNNQDYLKYTYLDDKIKIYCEGIYYLFEGKILLEYEQNLFTYFHQIIRKLHHNPLEGAVYISIQ